ncbi:hypothetical protein HOE37_03395 [Candidatus Woesearchaeota archaeon]|jgi:hypothetical protein|nr:hypothetical protein [Candidatus Woesearchaeota archaeon]
MNQSRNPPIHINEKFNMRYSLYSNPQHKRNTDEKELLFFSRMVDLFMLATIHGFKEGLRIPFEKPSEKTDIFKWSNFKDEDLTIIKSIGLLELIRIGNEDPNIINDKSRMVEIIQEYANGGFQDLMEILEENPDFEGNFISLILTK